MITIDLIGKKEDMIRRHCKSLKELKIEFLKQEGYKFLECEIDTCVESAEGELFFCLDQAMDCFRDSES